MNEQNKQDAIKAGQIAAQVKKYARTIIKKGVPLVDIANKIENKIIELGGKIAFPCNLSMDHVAAHYTPSHDDKTLAHGLLKIDLGVHINGWTADTAFSLDLEGIEENKKIIQTAEEAVKAGMGTIKNGIKIREIGKAIENKINKNELNPIINLSGHSIAQYDLHSGITIPNIDDGQEEKLKPGLYAIEPFATPGRGKVYDGSYSGIYQLINERNIRSPIAREILKYIIEEYSTLPFCSRWLVKKFGTRALFGLKQLQANGNIHSYSQLIESSKNKVAQFENTVLVEENKITITSLEQSDFNKPFEN